MSSIIRDFWIHTTILIENEWGKKGTGFLIGDETQGMVYLVTDKHVINNDDNKRHNSSRFALYFNIEDMDNALTSLKLEFCFDTNQWREHPNPDIDVIAFNVKQLFL